MIRVVQGSLSEMAVDAVFRAVRSDLAPVSAVGRDLGTRAGEQVEERLMRLGNLPVGGAVMTPSGSLPCAFLIHVVVMSEDEPQTASSVRKSLQNGLRRASDMGLSTLALPPIGIGVGLTEPEVEAGALVDVLVDHLNEAPDDLDITIVVSAAYEFDLFKGLIAERARAEGSE